MRPYLFFLLIAANLPLLAQNVGINATGAAPAAPAMLDVDAANRGVLVPRVALLAANNNAPIGVAIVNSLLVYNTATAGAGANVVSPGYYYWDASIPRWVRFAQGGDAWQILGNAGTAAATNFLGTTDNIALRMRTNNFERFEISTGTGGAAGTGGRLWAFQDGTAASPIYSWSANANTGIYRPLLSTMGFTTNAIERFRIPNANQVHAMAAGTAALPFYTWGADPNTGIWSGGADILGFSTTGVNRMRILATGQTIVATGIIAPLANVLFTVSAPAAHPTAIRGNAANNGEGVRGQAAGAGISDGVVGQGLQAGINGFGIWGLNSNAAGGNAIVGSGNNLGTTVPNNGSGGSFNGRYNGTYHYFTEPIGACQGALMQDPYGAVWRVGHWSGAAYFKILGTGAVSTVVNDVHGDPVALVCPEAPEALFQDYGVGRLVNGRAHIDLDPTLTRNIVIEADRPMKVFVQLEGECNGVYVTNKSATGFDVVELMGGTSDVEFSWSIVASRANETLTGPGGSRSADYSGRFVPVPEYEAPMNVESGRAAQLEDRP